jgi:hypothetical protein
MNEQLVKKEIEEDLNPYTRDKASNEANRTIIST